jgi:hypothetical protein
MIPCDCTETHVPRRIVVTGGPGASTWLHRIFSRPLREFPLHSTPDDPAAHCDAELHRQLANIG